MCLMCFKPVGDTLSVGHDILYVDRCADCFKVSSLSLASPPSQLPSQETAAQDEEDDLPKVTDVLLDLEDE